MSSREKMKISSISREYDVKARILSRYNRQMGLHETSPFSPFELRLKKRREERNETSGSRGDGAPHKSVSSAHDEDSSCATCSDADTAHGYDICEQVSYSSPVIVSSESSVDYKGNYAPPPHGIGGPPAPNPDRDDDYGPDPIGRRRYRDDMLLFYSLVALDNNWSKWQMSNQELVASANRGQDPVVRPSEVEQFLDNMYSQYRPDVSYRCQWRGHIDVLQSESEICLYCNREASNVRGTCGERLRMIQIAGKPQLDKILRRNFASILHYHREAHNGGGSDDFSIRESPSFRNMMENNQQFHGFNMTIQLSVNGDGFRMKQNTTGGLWPIYAQVLDLDTCARRKPMNALFLGMVSYGGTNKVDDDKLDEIISPIVGEFALFNNHSYDFIDDGGNHWKLRIVVNTTILDSEANVKLYGLCNWASTSHPACQYCQQIGVRSISRRSTTYTGVSGVLRTTGATLKDARFGQNGYFRLSVLHLLCSPINGTIDVLHIIDLGWLKDVEIALRGDSNNRLIRLPVDMRRALNKVSEYAVLPTYHPTKLKTFTSGAKSGRETRLSCFVYGCLSFLTFAPGLLRGRSTADMEACAIACTYYVIQILNFRRLLDAVVTQQTVQDVAATINQMGNLQEDAIGRGTYKQHLYNAHFGEQLLRKGNLADLDSASYEHLHLFLRVCLSLHNTRTYEKVVLRRALLKECVAEECRLRSVDTDLEEMVTYLNRRDAYRRPIDEDLLSCGIPKNSEFFPSLLDVRNDYRLYGLQNCIRYFKQVIIDGMTLASHDPIIGHPRPQKTRQDLITIRQGAVTHVGQIESIGLNRAGTVVFYLSCCQLDPDLGQGLLANLGRSVTCDSLRYYFQRVVSGNPYFTKKMNGGVLYPNCCTHMDIVGTCFEFEFQNETYFSTMPRKN